MEDGDLGSEYEIDEDGMEDGNVGQHVQGRPPVN